MSSAFTVLLPHRLNPRNNDALSICLDCLARNTRNDFTLLMDAAVDHELYPVMNRLVEKAPTDMCVFMHSDMFVAPGWDSAMLDAFDENTFVTGLLVEPGAIGVHSGNVQKDFGRKPETFRRAEFEAWAASLDAPEAKGEGWFAPYFFSRKRWFANGGHNVVGITEWTNRDIDMFEKWKAEGGRVVQARAFVYHLQRYSDPIEQSHPKRDIQG